MKIAGLSRQIALWMSALVLGVMVLVLVGSYVFYALYWAFWPPTGTPDAEQFFQFLVPTAPEWAWMISSTFVSLGVGVVVAVKLSQRILTPLNSVAENLRKLAHGDLTARAVGNDRSMGEAALLVDDFNRMAERLERLEREQVFWNQALAHELRTPVTILRGRLQGLADGVFEPDATLFRGLLTQIEGLTRLVEDLRVVGLADTGHLDLQWQHADLAAEVSSVVQLVDPGLRAAGLTVALDVDSAPARCDPMRIRQALLALLENARRHAVPGALRIQTQVSQGHCHLRVEDEGPGIDEALVAHIFEAFQRGEKSRSREGGGSGLGLAVVRSIAQAHGGNALCRPSVSGGTIFELIWPS